MLNSQLGGEGWQTWDAPPGKPKWYPSDEMMCWPVSARVGNIKNNDPSLIDPLNLP
jgi:hypothetical protein